MELCDSAKHILSSNKNFALKNQLTNEVEARIGQQIDCRKALKEVKKLPDIRLDKVEEIKNKIESGQYKISSEQIADSMIDRYFNN